MKTASSKQITEIKHSYLKAIKDIAPPSDYPYRYAIQFYINLLPHFRAKELDRSMPELLGISIRMWQYYKTGKRGNTRYGLTEERLQLIAKEIGIKPEQLIIPNEKTATISKSKKSK